MRYDVIKTKENLKELVTPQQINDFVIKELTETENGLEQKDVRDKFQSKEILFKGVWITDQVEKLVDTVKELLTNAPEEDVKYLMFNLMYADTSPDMEVLDDVMEVIGLQLKDCNIAWSIGESELLEKGFLKIAMVGFGE